MKWVCQKIFEYLSVAAFLYSHHHCKIFLQYWWSRYCALCLNGEGFIVVFSDEYEESYKLKSYKQSWFSWVWVKLNVYCIISFHPVAFTNLVRTKCCHLINIILSIFVRFVTNSKDVNDNFLMKALDHKVPMKMHITFEVKYFLPYFFLLCFADQVSRFWN